ncbi:MAG: hypothetical protein WCF85_09660 [Rhodospirillaceae bacterium]
MLDCASSVSIKPRAVTTRSHYSVLRLRTHGKAAKLEEVRGHAHVLTPGRYVGAADVEDDGVPFGERFALLKGALTRQLDEGARLSDQIMTSLEAISDAAS